jgi:hypothetical protein
MINNNSSDTFWDFYLYFLKEFTALIITISIYATTWYIQDYGLTSLLENLF